MATALQLLQLHAVLVQPLAVRMRLSQLLFDLTIVVNLTLLGVNQQNLTWLQTTFRHHIAWLEVHHANLAGHNHHTLFGNGVAAGAQTVSIEHSAGIATIAEQQRSRTIPRLHQDRVILIERLQVLRNRVLVVKALRHQDSHSLWQA